MLLHWLMYPCFHLMFGVVAYWLIFTFLWWGKCTACVVLYLVHCHVICIWFYVPPPPVCLVIKDSSLSPNFDQVKPGGV